MLRLLGVIFVVVACLNILFDFVITGAVIGFSGGKVISGIVFITGVVVIFLSRDSNGGLSDKTNDEWNLYETQRETPERLPLGEFHAGDIDFRFGPYKLAAYPGKGVVGENSRAEHLPYHCHVEQKGKTAYRIEVCGDEIKELDGKRIPKRLRRYILQNSEEIERRIRETFHTGDWEEAA